MEMRRILIVSYLNIYLSQVVYNPISIIDNHIILSDCRLWVPNCPIKARRMKISSKAGETAELNTSLLSLDTSQDDKDYGLNVEVSGDVMKDLDEILNN